MNVYDFDHTIYEGDSSVDFFWYVLSKKPYLVVLLPFQITGLLQYRLGIVSKECMKERFFVFLRFIAVQEMVIHFWNRNRKKIKSWYLRRKQDTDVIISASPEFILKPLVCDYLGVSLIASKINPYTCKFIGKNCYGEEKAVRFRAVYPTAAVMEFYSDSYTDTPLANMAEQAFMVRKNTITKWERGQ